MFKIGDKVRLKTEYKEHFPHIRKGLFTINGISPYCSIWGDWRHKVSLEGEIGYYLQELFEPAKEPITTKKEKLRNHITLL